MKTPRPVTIDFETCPIEWRPAYPPAPVSVSIKKWGRKPKFYAWGHLNGRNNCSREGAIAALRAVWDHPDGLLFHHSRFDLDVAETHLGLAPPPWGRTHDSVYLLYLDDPHAMSFALKPAAHAHLGMPPGERDAVADWLVENQPVDGVRITRSKAGAHIAWAPPEVVGPYADGDVIRTEGLFAKLHPSIAARGMLPAYDRERRLMPILLGMERQGVKIDAARLAADVALYRRVLARIDPWVIKKLGAGSDFNLDSDPALGRALVDSGLADPALMGLTPKGALSVGKESLRAGITDRKFSAILQYRSQLITCLKTFMEPWLRMAEASGGLAYTSWNQTRGGRGGGTVTGRLSSSRFQNMPKEFDPLFRHEADRIADPDERRAFLKSAPASPLGALPPLPLCRGYVVPYAPGHVLVGRDYSQQEPRILAHFEDGALLDDYRTDPWIDYHDNARENLERVFKRKFKRKLVKNINLGIIYGQGIASLALKNGESYEATKELRDAIYALYPGLKDLNAGLKARAAEGLPIRTWGGRDYMVERPKINKGRIMTFDYKLVNTLVQGSAADCTKEAMIRFAERQEAAKLAVDRWVGVLVQKVADRGWRILLQVHDEIVLSVPAGDIAEAQESLRLAMESVEFDVKILSEGEWSDANWGRMLPYDKKGEIVAVGLPRRVASGRKAAPR